MFRQLLDREEMNGLVAGVPTKAALGGAGHGRGKITRRGSAHLLLILVFFVLALGAGLLIPKDHSK
jgi:hypothetical protein